MSELFKVLWVTFDVTGCLNATFVETCLECWKPDIPFFSTKAD